MSSGSQMLMTITLECRMILQNIWRRIVDIIEINISLSKKKKKKKSFKYFPKHALAWKISPKLLGWFWTFLAEYELKQFSLSTQICPIIWKYHNKIWQIIWLFVIILLMLTSCKLIPFHFCWTVFLKTTVLSCHLFTISNTTQHNRVRDSFFINHPLIIIPYKATVE